MALNVFSVESLTSTYSLTLIFSGSNIIVTCSWPVNPWVSAVYPGKKVNGRIPIPIKLLLWILSKLWAITALTPCK